MTIGVRHPWEAVDYAELARLFPPSPDCFDRGWYAEPGEIDHVEPARLRHGGTGPTGVAPGALDELAELRTSPKPKRFLDERS